MIDLENIDYEALKNPPEPFRLLTPDNDDFEFFKKMRTLKKFLLEKYLYTSDEHRDPAYIDYSIETLLRTPGNAFYEIGDFQGLIGFVGLIPGFKCGMLLKFWDKSQWNKSFIRACQELIDKWMNEFQLKRIYAQTADPKVVRMAQMAGFKVDGECPNDFMWRGTLKPQYILSITREEK
jgi:RimJ/RimL family protein N-acetyltransferase